MSPGDRGWGGGGGGGAVISKVSLKTPKLRIFVGKYANKNAHFFMFWRQRVGGGWGDLKLSRGEQI